jgi:hypothetical protein
VTRVRHGSHAVSENGLAARNFAADAHGCIMVRVRIRPPEYKSVDAMFRAHWRVPLGSSET